MKFKIIIFLFLISPANKNFSVAPDSFEPDRSNKADLEFLERIKKRRNNYYS